MAQFNTRKSLSKFPVNSTNTNILHAIIALARTYAIAISFPTKYAKFGYDFPEMIKTKVMNLYELNPNSPQISTLSNSLLKSLNSPKEIINICMQHLKEMHQDCTPFVRRKEYANVYE